MNPTRRFLSNAISSALDFEVLSPGGVIKHISMDVIAHHLPAILVERLLFASLEAENMNARLVLDTLGVTTLAEHVPDHILWECVAAAAEQSLGRSSLGRSPLSASSSDPGELVIDSTEPSASNPIPQSKPNARKPNRSARPSRVRAGATSRLASQAPITLEPEEGPFDVDTRVGGDPSLNGRDEQRRADTADEVTSLGSKV